MNGFTALANGLKAKAHAIVVDVAAEVRDSAAGYSRVDTSSLQVGWYVISSDVNGYDAAVTAAENVNPTVVIMPVAGTAGATEAFIANVTSHAEVNEYGSPDGTRSAQPMLHPAISDGQPTMEARVPHLLDL